MGLTIHFTLRIPGTPTPDDVVAKMAALHIAVSKLPRQEQSPLVTLNDTRITQALAPSSESPWSWACIQHSQHHRYQFNSRGTPFLITTPGDQEPYYLRTVPAKHMVGFSVYPADGCEDLNLFVAQYPVSFIVDHDGNCHGTPPGKRRLMMEHPNQWSGAAFCKTQYASVPEHGGIQNFLRAHLLVIAAFDAARDLGFEVTVDDESGYWTERSISSLAHSVGTANEAILAISSQLRNAFGSDVVGALTPDQIAAPVDLGHVEAVSDDVLQLIRITKGTVAPLDATSLV